MHTQASGLHITTNFHIIKCWIESRHGKPAMMMLDGKSIPTIIFPGSTIGSSTREIGWHEFFSIIMIDELALMYEEDRRNGVRGMFFKFVPWEEYVDEIREEEKVENKVIIAENCFS